MSTFDEYYQYDRLNRLTQMQRGTLNSGKTGISGTPSREMDYTLDSTGNWSAYVTKTSGSTDLNQTRTANTVNEITAFGGTPAWTTPPSYDPAGNMTGFPQPDSPSNAYTAVYDANNSPIERLLYLRGCSKPRLQPSNMSQRSGPSRRRGETRMWPLNRARQNDLSCCS